jgi:hypothetical protein
VIHQLWFSTVPTGDMPPSPDAAAALRIENVHLRAVVEELRGAVDAAEKVAYDRAAEAAGVERSDWIRFTLNAAARKVLRPRPPKS